MGAASKGFFGATSLPPSLPPSLPSFRNAEEEVVKSRAQSLFLASPRSLPVSFRPLLSRSDLKKVSERTFQLVPCPAESPRTFRGAPCLSVRPSVRPSTFLQFRIPPLLRCPRPASVGRVCRLPCACHYIGHDIAVGGNKPLFRSKARSESGRLVRSFVRSVQLEFANKSLSPSLPACLPASLPPSSLSRCSCSFRTPERVGRSRPRG